MRGSVHQTDPTGGIAICGTSGHAAEASPRPNSTTKLKLSREKYTFGLLAFLTVGVLDYRQSCTRLDERIGAILKIDVFVAVVSDGVNIRRAYTVHLPSAIQDDISTSEIVTSCNLVA
jgi:hypothetical protein